jgi:hypothetical protein
MAYYKNKEEKFSQYLGEICYIIVENGGKI